MRERKMKGEPLPENYRLALVEYVLSHGVPMSTKTFDLAKSTLTHAAMGGRVHRGTAIQIAQVLEGLLRV